MSQDRRTTDRRRRILYSSQTADTSKPTAASRRAKEKLREAQQPTKAYGSRVHRRLRSRWFSVVPVKRRTLVIFAAVIGGCALLLSYAHLAAVTWPSLVYQPEISRPLRLDRPDSFGRWFVSSVLVASAGVSLLIYQLRRHRTDDYRGHYRLWRLVIFVMLLTSVNSLVMVVDWGGSLLDVAFGRRVAFSGYDWLRIVLGVGGVVLALRLVVEVRRSRWALVMLVSACFFLTLPEATKWKLFAIEDIYRWALVTSAPLLGYTSLFLSLTGYLRLLYREVRGIVDKETVGQRFKTKTSGWFRSQKTDEEKSATKTRRTSRQNARTEPEYVQDEGEQEQYEADEVVYADDEQQQSEATQSVTPAAEQDVQTPRKKRRWLGLRAAKPDTHEQSEESPKPKKKRRFGLRLDPGESNGDESDGSTSDVEESESSAEPPADDQDETRPKKKRRFGLSWRNKKEAVEDTPEEIENEAVEVEDTSEQQQYESAELPSDNDEINEDEIDWSSMSKSERRRLRKKLKRKGRAA